MRVNTLASSPEDWYPLRAHAQFHQVFLVLGYLCNPLRIILWYTSGYFPCYAIPKRRRPRWRHFAVLLTSEAHKRSEQTRSSSYLHTNSPDTCTVKNACGFTACYPENILKKKKKKRSASFLRGIRVGWGGYMRMRKTVKRCTSLALRVYFALHTREQFRVSRCEDGNGREDSCFLLCCFASLSPKVPNYYYRASAISFFLIC